MEGEVGVANTESIRRRDRRRGGGELKRNLSADGFPNRCVPLSLPTSYRRNG